MPARSVLALLVTAFGCRPQPLPPTPPRAIAPPSEPVDARDPVPAEPLEAATPVSEFRRPILQIRADWDANPGLDDVVLYDDGELHAGDDRGIAKLPTKGGYFFGEQASIDVVELGAPSFARAVVVALPTPDDEDPPNVYQVFVSTPDGLHRIFEQAIGAYGVHPLSFPGDGTAQYLEDGWTACERADFPTRAKLHRVTLGIGNDGVLVEQRRDPAGDSVACEQLAACPFVDVIDDAGTTRIGEILRNIRGQHNYTSDALHLPAATQGAVVLRISEEKDEVTYLDSVVLLVDGVELPAKQCDHAAPPASCAADRSFFVLRRGDTLELEFDVPASATEVLVQARGYYSVPRRP